MNKARNEKPSCPGTRWLIPVILMTQEADQEDHGSKPAWENSWRDPISKNRSQKRAGGVAQGEGPEFKLQL
jgi:hypothetical protein